MSDQPRYAIEWQSSPAQRYDSLLTARVGRLIRATLASSLDWYGGSDGTTADNGVVLTGLDLTDVTDLAQNIADATGCQTEMIDYNGPAGLPHDTLEILHPFWISNNP